MSSVETVDVSGWDVEVLDPVVCVVEAWWVRVEEHSDVDGCTCEMSTGAPASVSVPGPAFEVYWVVAC